MNLLILILTIMLTNINRGDGREASQSQKIAPFVVKKCSDFDLTGKDDGSEWSKTEWNYLTKLDEGGKIYTTKFKILYSEKGIYVLFTGEDDKISTRYDQDFDDLFKGDV
ncbi:MAG TPA: hypothetical protein VGQ53_07175, partial [Chitinophagaceae bacterium]|nr:hypothetical protein [Chitinophagaceae bacterium]